MYISEFFISGNSRSDRDTLSVAAIKIFENIVHDQARPGWGYPRSVLAGGYTRPVLARGTPSPPGIAVLPEKGPGTSYWGIPQKGYGTSGSMMEWRWADRHL